MIYLYITTRSKQSVYKYTNMYTTVTVRHILEKKLPKILSISLTGNFFRCWTFLVINMKVKVYICITVYDMLVVIVIVVAMVTIIVTMVDVIPKRW